MSDVPTTVPVCYRHPARETYVRCTRCERPICPDCMNEASVGHQCPECVAEGRRTQRPARTAFGGSAAGRGGVVTMTLLAVNILVMVLSVASAGGSGGGLFSGATPLTQWGAVIGYAIYGSGEPVLHGVAAGEWYRLFTAMFLHYGLLHLLMNMYALWILGRDLERVLGPLRFAGLYVLAGLGGNVAAYLFSAPNAATAGASTAVFGLMAATFVLLRRLGLSVAPIMPVIVINIVITFAVVNISIAGHLGGLVVGALVAAVLAYAPRSRRNLVQGAGVAVIVALLLALAVYQTAALL